MHVFFYQGQSFDYNSFAVYHILSIDLCLFIGKYFFFQNNQSFSAPYAKKKYKIISSILSWYFFLFFRSKLTNITWKSDLLAVEMKYKQSMFLGTSNIFTCLSNILNRTHSVFMHKHYLVCNSTLFHATFCYRNKSSYDIFYINLKQELCFKWTHYFLWY